jgi:hypothetical protein
MWQLQKYGEHSNFSTGALFFVLMQKFSFRFGMLKWKKSGMFLFISKTGPKTIQHRMSTKAVSHTQHETNATPQSTNTPSWKKDCCPGHAEPRPHHIEHAAVSLSRLLPWWRNRPSETTPADMSTPCKSGKPPPAYKAEMLFLGMWVMPFVNVWMSRSQG